MKKLLLTLGLVCSLSAFAQDENIMNKYHIVPDNKINGTIPPGKVAGIKKLMLNESENNKDYFVDYVTHNPGTRAPVHFHNFLVISCIISGVSTFYAEGSKPKEYHAGECYLMKPFVKGCAVNNSSKPVIMTDTTIKDNGSFMHAFESKTY